MITMLSGLRGHSDILCHGRKGPTMCVDERIVARPANGLA